MKIKGITDEDFVNYKVPSMFIATSKCNFKCDRECGRQICQNGTLAKQKNMNVKCEDIVTRYLANPITHAIVFGGLEPMDQFDDVCALIILLRTRFVGNCQDDVVIYTGYTKDELEKKNYLRFLRSYGNVIIKYGRFIPDQAPHFDPVLGVNLASDNQYAERLTQNG